MNKTLVVLAAGMGSRFGGLKQIEPVGPNGEFIIDYSIYDAIKMGFNKVVFIIKKENYNLFRETIGSRIENNVKVEYVFQNFENDPSFGKIIFWSTLFSITDMQINKDKKIIRLNFYSEEKGIEKQLKLTMENILFFREALVKRMSNLKIKIESNKLIKGQPYEKRLTPKDINKMNIKQIEERGKNFNCS